LHALAARIGRHGRECLRAAAAFNAARGALKEIGYVKLGRPGPGLGADPGGEADLRSPRPGADQNAPVAQRHKPKGGFMSIRNFVLTAILLATAVSASALTAQQEKMKGCNAQAKEQNLSGDARQGFMKTCLSNAPAAPAAKALTPQQEKMKSCNADAKAKSLKGNDRKAFMKTCLSGA
jgi:hypothetical protein